MALEHFTGERFEATRLLAGLPELSPATRAAAPVVDVDGADPLRQIEPVIYVAALTGREAGRDRKVSCPLHPDRTPSLHVYTAPEDGWFCFGC